MSGVVPVSDVMEALAANQRLRDALHLAFDWMGRQPQNAWELAHLKVAQEQAEAALHG